MLHDAKRERNDVIEGPPSARQTRTDPALPPSALRKRRRRENNNNNGDGAARTSNLVHFGRYPLRYETGMIAVSKVSRVSGGGVSSRYRRVRVPRCARMEKM